MPLIEREQFEEILNKLHGEIEHSEKTDLLQQLRAAQSNAYTEFEDINTQLNKVKDDNNDLLLSNSKLFRQLEITKPTPPQEVQKKEFSETITIEQLEKGI